MGTVLHVISDKNRQRLPLHEALVESARGGADVIQIREKKAPASEVYALVQHLKQVLAERDLTSRIFVNDRLDIAIASETSGAHLAAKSLPVEAANRLRKVAAWTGKIGCSVHALDEALRAEQEGADYVTFGHVFASASHPGAPPRGLQTLREVVDALAIPVIAIGGIDHGNVGAVLETGCSGIAVIGAVLDTADVCLATRTLKHVMEHCKTVPKVSFWP